MADSGVFNTYNNIVGKIGGIARHASGYITKAASLFNSGDGWSSSAIRDAYLGGFLGDTAQFTPNVFSRIFDEPTYLTFRVVFDFDPNPNKNTDDLYSDYTTQFDYMPEPFLVLPVSNSIREAYNIKKYSTYKYLVRNLGDYYRKDMLWLFGTGLKDLSENYSYYFQSIDGLGDLMKVAPQNGIRIKDDEGIIKIKCYEGLDMKVTQLMQLYRKIVWDDVYQRWVLPDMMRFFSMKIYISEIRLFHSMSSQTKSKQSIMYELGNSMNTTIYNSGDSDILKKIDNIIETASAISAKTLGTNSTISQILNSANATMDMIEGVLTLPGDYIRLCNNAINDVMPTICLECHQCEFVIDDTLEHINSLSSSNSKEQTEPTITIKVGRLIDKQLYPLNADLGVKNNKYYSIDIQKPYMSGAYIDDEILAKGYDYDNDTEKTSDRAAKITEDTRISSGMNRIRTSINTQNNNDMSYQLFNSPKDNTALSMTYSILNQFTPQEALSAATAVKEIRYALDHGEYAEMIKSMATDEEMQNRIKYNVFSNVLDNLSKSTATDTSLSKLSRDLLYYMQEQASEYRSKATEAQTDIEI